jgi:UDP-N-acetylmuramate--alanine ligase
VIPKQLEHLRVHMVGVGGCGMSGLAAMLLRHNAVVSGTDRSASQTLSELAEAGVRVDTRQDGSAMPDELDVVVVSAAIPEDHPERRRAIKRGVPVIKYAELLGAVMRHHEGIAIAGTHGKSTTTAWLAYALRQANLDPSFVVGAQVSQLGGGSGVGSGPWFIAEACEFDRSFLNLAPRCAAILNIEEDHLDCYANLTAIQESFAAFARQISPTGLLVINGDDPNCAPVAAASAAPVETFGSGPACNWQAHNAQLQDGHYAADIHYNDNELGRVRFGLPGRQNVENALAVCACAHHAGVDWDDLVRGLQGFQGAQRRLELRGQINAIRVLDDYGHHPTEIRATLRAVRERYTPRQLWCVFQPHQHSRTRFLLDDFAASFADADEVIVPDIYFVRDSEREREQVNAQDLVARIRNKGGRARYVPNFEDIVELLSERLLPSDVALTLGAGTIWKVADDLVRRLGAHLPS